jgi:arylsulfatase A-like enzyme
LRQPKLKAKEHQQVALQGLELNDESHALLRTIKKRPAFLLAGPWVFLLLEETTSAPPSLALSESLDLGTGKSGAWRVELGPYSAEGIPLLASQSANFDLAPIRGSVLRARWVAVGDPAQDAHVRVLWNGEVVFEEQRPFDAVPQPRSMEVALSEGRGLLTLEVLGSQAGFTAFLKPVLSPPLNGDTPSSPRDVVLLLADTFRADNLAAWGGDPDLCPRLNQLADRGQRHTNTRAPATWTLPSQAAMFSGLYPPQVSVRLYKDRLPDEAWTMAEHFQSAGYRTVAITDGGFVGRPFGFAQGFEWFEEGEVDVPRMLASVQRELDADDGRPLFLFVQSYRAHKPYRVDDITGERLAQSYPVARSFEKLEKAIASDYETLERGAPAAGAIGSTLGEYETWYRLASASLDLAFGSILDSLEGAGILENGVVAFTSDHGESFGEHGVFEHGQGVWDEEAAVPLILRAPDLPSGSDSSPASLVDLPRTLTGLAGIQVHSDWIGRNLCQSSDEPPIVSYQSRPWQKNLDMAVVYRGHKWILDAHERQVLHLYDLARDPKELIDLNGPGSGKPLLEELRALLKTLDEPLVSGQAAQTTAAAQAQLDALGYTGDSDEE